MKLLHGSSDVTMANSQQQYVSKVNFGTNDLSIRQLHNLQLGSGDLGRNSSMKRTSWTSTKTLTSRWWSQATAANSLLRFKLKLHSCQILSRRRCLRFLSKTCLSLTRVTKLSKSGRDRRLETSRVLWVGHWSLSEIRKLRTTDTGRQLLRRRSHLCLLPMFRWETPQCSSSLWGKHLPMKKATTSLLTTISNRWGTTSTT